MAGLAAFSGYLHPRVELVELLPVPPRLGAAALEVGLHVVPEERRDRHSVVRLIVADGLPQLALEHGHLAVEVEEHDEDAAGRRAQEHEQDDDVGPCKVI